MTPERAQAQMALHEMQRFCTGYTLDGRFVVCTAQTTRVCRGGMNTWFACDDDAHLGSGAATIESYEAFLEEVRADIAAQMLEGSE